MSLTLTLERGGGGVSGSGTNIELDGTIAGGAIESVEMYGDTEQTTYSGKNLYQSIGITTQSGGLVSVLQEDGRLRITGQATSNSSNFAGTMTTNLPAGTYTFSITKALPFRVLLRSNDNQNHWVLEAGQTSITQTINSPLTSLWVWGYLLTSGTTYDETVGFMLESGSLATSFEPYVGGTASPNPDYPQEVQTVTGRQVVTISDGGSESQEYEINLGKNLCDGISQGYWLTSAATNAGVSSGDTGLIIPIEQNTSYTISTTSSQSRYRIAFSDQTYQGSQFNCYSGTNRDGTSDAITKNSENHKYLIVNATDLTRIQIEKGSTATTYAPYFTPIELCKIGTYQDYIYKSGENWYVHKEISTKTYVGASSEGWYLFSYGGNTLWRSTDVPTGIDANAITSDSLKSNNFTYWVNDGTSVSVGVTEGHFGFNATATNINIKYAAVEPTLSDWTTWLTNHPTTVYYPLTTPTDTQITNSALIAQLEALNAGDTYDGTTLITVSSENLAGSLDVTVSSNITKTYTEVEIGSPFTIADVEGKSSNTTLDGNVYVDWAYNKKQYSFDLFNLTPQDYSDIRAFYDYQFNNSAFPTITVPELNIDKLPVYMEISSRNIINQCLLTDKLTIKFRETVQP